MGFQADVRAACITTLDAHATAQSVKLQTYPGRPRSLYPPSAFVDALRSTNERKGITIIQKTVQADIVLIHGLFDSGDAVAQKDAFVDGYIEYIRLHEDAAGANTTFEVVSTEDDPTFVPDWLPREEQRTYFATRITVEGYSEDN